MEQTEKPWKKCKFQLLGFATVIVIVVAVVTFLTWVKIAVTACSAYTVSLIRTQVVPAIT